MQLYNYFIFIALVNPANMCCNNLYARKIRTLLLSLLFLFKGWMGYSSDKVKAQCRELMAEGFTGFKIKVGQDLENDKERCKMVRDVIGPDNVMVTKKKSIK